MCWWMAAPEWLDEERAPVAMLCCFAGWLTAGRYQRASEVGAGSEEGDDCDGLLPVVVVDVGGSAAFDAGNIRPGHLTVRSHNS